MAHAVSPLAVPLPTLPEIRGVRSAVTASGLRYKGRDDLLLVELASGTTVAGVFTTNLVCGHPVTWCRKILPHGRARALVVNAGNANVFRGAEGDHAVRVEAEAAARLLGCEAEEVYVASTGVIGQKLDAEAIAALLPGMHNRLDPHGLERAARAIMTTDTFAKGATTTVDVAGAPVRIAGIAKGSGMIAPNMATMLSFVFTDAAVAAPALQTMLAAAVDRSFNGVTVDSDMSTSDTLLVFATGAAGNAPITDPASPSGRAFAAALEQVCRDLAIAVARDGEGATKLVTIDVEGAVSDASARKVALAIGNSPLVKTAIHGQDANWGRVAMAVGKAGEPVDVGALRIAFGGHDVARDGGAVPNLDEAPIQAHLAGQEVGIQVGVGKGPGRARVWTCDLGHAYIDINGSYRS